VNRLLTARDVAERLQMSQAWVRDHATRREPRLPVVRIGNTRSPLRFRAEDIDAFIEQHLVRKEAV
jgi:predicted DNA-binding transcriptional regulator AlpA